MRAILYVDGFNLYHAIHELNDNRLKWLSLRDLGQTIIPKRSETLEKVLYFSAFAHHLSARDPSIVARHEDYVAALESTGVEVILGNFKSKPRKCHTCNAKWLAHEEKETDVNIAVRLTSDAYRDEFDVAYVLTADTDIVPAIRCVRSVSGADGLQKQVVAVFPPMQNRNVNSLIDVSNRQIRLNLTHIANARLKETITRVDGTKICCPSKYI